MGYRISWLAAQGLARAEVLHRLDLHKTDIEDEANDAPFSAAELPSGWVVIFANDLTYAEREAPDRLAAASNLLTCTVHEGLGYVSATAFTHGVRQWTVTYDAQEDPETLTMDGVLPPELQTLYTEMLAGADTSEPIGNVLIDVPLKLAAAVTGYEHDMVLDDVMFMEVEPNLST